MNVAIRAYAKTARTGLTGRALEAALLLQYARELERCAGQVVIDAPALIHAATNNRRFWAMLAADATEPLSQLPEHVRANIVAITAFVFKQTHLAFIDPGQATLAPLIRINREIAAGLSGIPPEGMAPPPAAQAGPAPERAVSRRA